MPVTLSGKLHHAHPEPIQTTNPSSAEKKQQVVRWFLTIIIGAFVCGMIVAVLSLWAATGFKEIGAHGFALYALVIGGGFTMALTAGLMAALFYSDRAGFDEGAYRPDQNPPRDDVD
jgi:hypothetical protein